MVLSGFSAFNAANNGYANANCSFTKSSLASLKFFSGSDIACVGCAKAEKENTAAKSNRVIFCLIMVVGSFIM